MGSSKTLEQQDNPYVGPRTFSPEERAKFFGRDQEAYELTSLIIANRLVLFYSPSGAGKSSLLNTMIGPMLAEAGFEILPTGRVNGYSGRDTPADNIFVYNLISSLHDANEIPPDFETLTLADFLDNLAHHEGGAYHYDPGYVYPPDAVFKPRALFVDQFEELITTNTAAWPQRPDFFQQLAKAMTLDEQLWVVLIMREDYVANFDPYLHLMPNQLRYRYYMERLARDEAAKAIKMPVENLRPFEPEAIERLLDNMLRLRGADGQNSDQFAQFIEPVQLQAVCYQMWEELRHHPGPSLTVDDVTRFADVDKALTNFYEETIKQTVGDMTVSEIDLRDWFEQELITEAGTRNMVFRGEEMTGSLPTEVADYVRRQFILGEVVRPGGTWYELVHDRFVTPIVAANNLWRQDQPVIQLAADWDNADRPDERLLNRQRLEQVLAEETWVGLGPLVYDYITAAQEKQKREEQRVQAQKEEQLKKELASALRFRRLNRWLSVAAGVALLLFFIAGFAGILANNSARAAHEAQMTAVAESIRAEEKADEAIAESIRAAENLAIAEQERERADENAAEAIAESTRAAEILAIAEQERKRADQQAQEAEDERIRAKEQADLALEQAQIALSRQLAAQANNYQSEQLDLSLLLALEAIRLFDSTEARSSLLSIIQSTVRPTQLITSDNRTIAHSQGEVTSLAFASDSQTLVSGSSNGTILVWDAFDGQPGRQLPFSFSPSLTRRIVFQPNGDLLAAGGYDGRVFLYDFAADQLLHTLSTGLRRVLGLAITPDGQTLATTGDSSQILFWDTVSGRSTGTINTNHASPIAAVALNPDGTLLASGGASGRITLWDMISARSIGQPFAAHTGSVTVVGFSPDGKTLASAGSDGNIFLWDVDTRQKVGEFPQLHQDAIFTLAFDPSGKILVSGGSDSLLYLWDVETRQTIEGAYTNQSGWIWSAAFSPDGSKLASGGLGGRALGAQDAMILIRDVERNQQLGQLLYLFENAITNLVYSPNGETIAMTGNDNNIYLWDISAGHFIGEPLRVHTTPITSITFSADSAFIVSGDSEGITYLWNLAVFPPEGQLFYQQTEAVTALAFRPDNQTLAIGSFTQTTIVNVQDGQVVNQTQGQSDSVNSLAFSPGGQALAIGSRDGTVRLYDTDSTEELLVLVHPEPIDKIIFSPDGETLATAYNNSIALWTGTGEFFSLPTSNQTAVIEELAFSPDGRMLMSAHRDGSLILWDVSTYQRLGRLLSGNTGMILAIAFSPDGETLISTDSAGGVYSWRVGKTGWQEIACELAGRNSSWAEWQLFLPDQPYHQTCPQWPVHPSVPAEVLSEAES